MMKKLLSTGFLALFGLVFILNGAEASHFRPISVMVNKPVGEEVVVEESVQDPTQETAQETARETAQESAEKNTGKSCEESETAPIEGETFGGVCESCGCDEPCWEEDCSCCAPRRFCHRRLYWRWLRRWCCTPMIGSDCGCGN